MNLKEPDFDVEGTPEFYSTPYCSPSLTPNHINSSPPILKSYLLKYIEQGKLVSTPHHGEKTSAPLLEKDLVLQKGSPLAR